MYKIAVMGDYDSIYGFATIGYDVIPVTDPGEAEDKLEELAEGGYGIIFVTEALAAGIRGTIDKYRSRMLPAVILIPGVSGNTGEGIENVKKTVEQAVGSDILFSQDK